MTLFNTGLLAMYTAVALAQETPQAFENLVPPCKGRKSCELIVESVQKLELGCYLKEKTNSPTELHSVYLEEQCRIHVTDSSSKKRYSIYAGADGCKLKIGQKVELDIVRVNCGERVGLFDCIKNGPLYQIENLDKYNHQAKYCNIKQRGWVEKKLVPNEYNLPNFYEK